MFVIPSRDRVKKLRELAASFGQQDLKQPVMVVVCSRDPNWEDYFDERWPERWQVHVAEGDFTYCGEKMNWAYARLPDAKFYGHLCDDVLIGTQDKLAELVEVAGDWNIAYPNDGVYHGDLTCFPVSGGKLTRLWGWWAHPWFKHNCLDSVIDDIGRTLGVLKYCKDVKFVCKHPLFGNAEWDETYRRVEPINREAGVIFDTKWKDSQERREFMDRIKREMNAQREVEVANG